MESAPPEGGAASRKRELASAATDAGAPGGTSERVAAATRESIRTLKMSSVGIELAVSVLLGLFAGRWLDGKLGTAPWLMIVLLCLGFTAGLRSIMRTMDKASRDADRAAAKASTGEGKPRGDGPGSAA